tara:strand:- start:224 stop:643 length:420 start_codon:yes stop_codon:yes gene_type:complete
MAKIKSIGKAECRALGEELEVVIQRALNKYGLTANHANGRYAGHTATLSFKIDVPAMAEKVANRDAELLGAKFNVGYVFNSNGEEFKVTGFNLRRRKYPVSADNTRTGKSYKFTVENINRNILIAEMFEKSREKETVTA